MWWWASGSKLLKRCKLEGVMHKRMESPFSANSALRLLLTEAVSLENSHTWLSFCKAAHPVFSAPVIAFGNLSASVYRDRYRIEHIGKVASNHVELYYILGCYILA